MTPDDEETRDVKTVFGGWSVIIIAIVTAVICGAALIEHEDPWRVLASLMPW